MMCISEQPLVASSLWWHPEGWNAGSDDWGGGRSDERVKWLVSGLLELLINLGNSSINSNGSMH